MKVVNKRVIERSLPTVNEVLPLREVDAGSGEKKPLTVVVVRVQWGEACRSIPEVE